MGKISTRINAKHSAKHRLSQNQSVEGRLYVEFTFDGITHKREHLFTANEMKMMKQQIVEHGDKAAGTVLWQHAIHNAGVFGENVLAVAAQLYSINYYKGENQAQVQTSARPQPVIIDDIQYPAPSESEKLNQYYEDLKAAGIIDVVPPKSI